MVKTVGEMNRPKAIADRFQKDERQVFPTGMGFLTTKKNILYTERITFTRKTLHLEVPILSYFPCIYLIAINADGCIKACGILLNRVYLLVHVV